MLWSWSSLFFFFPYWTASCLEKVSPRNYVKRISKYSYDNLGWFLIDHMGFDEGQKFLETLKNNAPCVKVNIECYHSSTSTSVVSGKGPLLTTKYFIWINSFQLNTTLPKAVTRSSHILTSKMFQLQVGLMKQIGLTWNFMLNRFGYLHFYEM